MDSGTGTSVRRYELDWLRVMAILVVFVYHSTRFFNLEDWHVKNDATYLWVEIWIVYASLWLMPLFFIISGASLFYAMGRLKGWSRFYVNKFLRLMIPVLVASVTHSALQVYLERSSHGQFPGTFFTFIPEYFNGVYLAIGMHGNYAWHGLHLWYLFFLFVYSLICYPLLSWLRGGGARVLNRITKLLGMPGLTIVWFSVPILLMNALLPHEILEVGSGGWGFLFYIWFLIAGFMIVSSDHLQKKIKQHAWLSLLMAVIFTTAYLYQRFSPSRLVLPDRIGDGAYTLLACFSAWSWLLAMLGWGMRLLAFDRPCLSRVNQGVMPFYILHQTVLLGVGYFVMAWHIHDILKWALVFAGSLTIVVALYLYLIRKFDLLRFLFGMKTSRPVFDIFRKKRTLIPLHALFVGLIVLAVANQMTARTPMPMNYRAETDVVLNSRSISGRSAAGVQLVDDQASAIGEAIAFESGANPQAEARPEVYIDMRFYAAAGRYTVWLRGKCEVDNVQADSVWLQVDDQVGTAKKAVRMGNWLDVHPAGVYAWAGDAGRPVAIELKTTGDHLIRIQPRQTPHRIDQIWLSRFQPRIPNTPGPVR